MRAKYRVGVVAVAFEQAMEGTDSIVVAHREACAEALRSIMDGNAVERRELLAPRLERRGTLRERPASPLP
jgi:hypothetical protein